ncbi:MAG TPA: histidine kinase dimerization/phospho-acceptor domain-containing protein [Longimicrobiales bacterium]
MDDSTRRMYDVVREVRHDLNGPLTSALGNIQMLLEDGALGDGDARASLEEVEADLRRLAAMIRRLSDVRPPDESA